MGRGVVGGGPETWRRLGGRRTLGDWGRVAPGDCAPGATGPRSSQVFHIFTPRGS